jgi:hypothetical protein
MSAPDRPPLTLPEYRILVKSLPRPTLLQMQQFAVFVSNAHSWYKHLPYLPPGLPFYFFLDPAAGMQLAVKPQGSVDATPRTECGFHYSWLPTAEYRDRFGYLAYSRIAGTRFSSRSDDGTWLVSSDVGSSVYDPTAHRLCQLPTQVRRVGRAFVSGVAHTCGADERFWLGMVRMKTPLEWPEESGGLEAVTRILDRCRVLEEDPSQKEQKRTLDPKDDANLWGVDYPLYQLLEPERQRQLAGMVSAMKRVIELVDKSSV